MAFDRAKWVEENHAGLRAYHTAWRRRNRQRLRQKANSVAEKAKRKIREAKPHAAEKTRQRVLKWQKDHPEKVNTKNAKWKRENRDPEKDAHQVRLRRARKKNAGGQHTIVETRELLENQEFLCANPKCRIDLREHKKHLDHKQPLSLGGSNSIENLQWLCQPCNGMKGYMSYADWLTRVS